MYLTNNRILLLSLICTISFMGCEKHSSNNSITCLDVSTINEKDSLSSIFKSFEIIRLETVDESLIGRRINKIRKKHHKYFISYDNKALVQFDRQGVFLRKIQNIGSGPGEYISLVDFDVLPNGNIIIQDNRKLLFYASTGEFIKAIPLGVTCFNFKIIGDNTFLICASGEEYSIYLINGNGEILSKQIETNNIPVLGRTVSFFTFGNKQILYQQDVSNDFLSFDIKTGEFSNINLLCNKDNCLTVKTINKHKKRDSGNDPYRLEYNVNTIGGFSSYSDYVFFAYGNQSSGFKCYFMNTIDNTIDYVLTENTVNDISFTVSSISKCN
ncbi:hypothetical protein EZS27_003500 [termite gut metagenome]|uniref:6-bladed beta-propeller n=1 Tax=termite gut metagenome TaxID=433724 RepID=A0A5J4SSG0_9ZZZZ